MSWIGDDMKNPNTRVWIVATFLLLCSNIVWIVLYINTLASIPAKAETQIQTPTSELMNGNNETNTPIEDPDNGWHDGYTGEGAVYVVPDGKKYHTNRGCAYLRRSSRVLTVDPIEACDRLEKCTGKDCRYY